MAAKRFSKNNPLEKLGGIQSPESKEIPVEESISVPSEEKKKKSYLKLDITDYQEYINLMAAHLTTTSGKYVSKTQYILGLLKADKEKNIELYEKLEKIEEMKKKLI